MSAVQVLVSLYLPRDELTVPVARHIVRDALREVGVTSECTIDVEIALSEACTNVLKHAGPGDAYELTLELEDDECTIRVVDRGHGFDSEAFAAGDDSAAEQGRGIVLMRALVDRVLFTSRPEAGTTVHLQKALEYVDGSLAGRALAHRTGPP